MHCGCGAKPGPGTFSAPLPPRGQAFIRSPPAHSTADRARPAPERETVSPAPPSQLILGGWGVAPPPSQDRGRGWGGKTRPRGARRIYGREWFPSAPCTFLCTDPGIPESSHLQRQDTAWPMASPRMAGERERTYNRSLYMVTCFSFDLQVIALYL